MTPRHKRRTALTPNEKAEVMAALAGGHKAAVIVSTNSQIGSPEYVAAGEANDGILKLARILTNDPNALLAPLHSSPSRPKYPPPKQGD